MKAFLNFALLISGAVAANGASITLVSQLGGTYEYGLTLGAGENIAFDQGDSIVLSGLSGVTGATTTGQLSILQVSFTPATVTLVIPPLPFQTASFGAANTFERLTVTSTVQTAGNVSYSIDSRDDIEVGLVLGPGGRAVVPEPGTFGFLGAGLACLITLRRRVA